MGLQNLQDIGEDMVAYEWTIRTRMRLWPEAPEHLWSNGQHLTDAQIDKITHQCDPPLSLR